MHKIFLNNAKQKAWLHTPGFFRYIENKLIIFKILIFD